MPAEHVGVVNDVSGKSRFPSRYYNALDKDRLRGNIGCLANGDL